MWEDFLSRPSDYFALLAELGFATEDTKKAHGDLPEEIIEAVRAQELLTDNIKASLRGYQSFAARFALVQDKVIIGDEMGLGKTVEALAVLAHLQRKGNSTSSSSVPQPWSATGSGRHTATPRYERTESTDSPTSVECALATGGARRGRSDNLRPARRSVRIASERDVERGQLRRRRRSPLRQEPPYQARQLHVGCDRGGAPSNPDVRHAAGESGRGISQHRRATSGPTSPAPHRSTRRSSSAARWHPSTCAATRRTCSPSSPSSSKSTSGSECPRPTMPGTELRSSTATSLRCGARRCCRATRRSSRGYARSSTRPRPTSAE